MFDELAIAGGIGLVILIIGVGVLLSKFFRKVEQGTALVRNGLGGAKVSFTSAWVFPIIHHVELMDISVKRIEIKRRGNQGLICKDNMRADIEVAFFVRVNNEPQEVLHVARSLGCRRASSQEGLVELFDAKFSEGLKTVGKHFDFVELYNSREQFKEEIIKVIGTELNGYILEDAAIDFLEQTPVEQLDPDNILDAEGIKKITDLTAKQQVLANNIAREKEKTIKKQDVEARETILELERQQEEAEQKQQREIAAVTAREQAEARKVEQEQRLKAEQARIKSDEEIAVAEENKLRQVIVAAKNKERTNAVESERVEKDRQLEVTERERIVSLAQIEKDKSIEVEKKHIQDVIRERVIVERAVVEEQERIKDTQEFAAADRLKQVTVTKAEMEGQEELVKRVKAAQAEREAAELFAQQLIVEAEAQRGAAEKETAAKKMLAEARTAEEAAAGLAEAQVIEAKATALEKEGTAQASVLQSKAIAEAAGLSAMAEAKEKDGTAEAKVIELKFAADAQGIEQKAEAMKLFNEAGKEHEEFKLRLAKEKDVELAAIEVQRHIAGHQADIMAEALKSAKIDIVGGETEFFDKIVHAISQGKRVDRFFNNTDVMTDIKNTFFNGDGAYFETQLQRFIDRFNIDTEDVKNLSVAALIGKMISMSNDSSLTEELQQLLGVVQRGGLGDKRAGALDLGGRGNGQRA